MRKMQTDTAGPVRPRIHLWLLATLLPVLAFGLTLALDGLRGGREAPATPHLQPALAQATLLPGPRRVEPFTLTAHNGAPFTEASLRGRWSLLAFGYTSCPDICPTALANLARVRHLLTAEDADTPYRTVFVSVDPERDTTARLAGYVPYFHPSFIGATGTPAELAGLARQLGIRYEKVEAPDSAMGYLVDHSAAILLINPRGEYAAVFGAPHDPRLMATDIQAIARAAAGNAQAR
ncbi:protein SCO1/2 [Thioalbus denitrificans]|uniref:Protein SCO1/2 n=2 Tax=Thioalbus denitrificans TaxID=547122 RepID=A0A369CC60_9GAMM|nr:protein SCO1/2 [Thioalbus denitrificans]